MNEPKYRYFLSYDDGPLAEVDREEWIRVERAAGFNGPEGKLATSGFSGWVKGQRVRGKLERLTVLR